jgi:SAM-dependent methyltransferase
MEEPIPDIGCGNGFFANVSLRENVFIESDTDISQVCRARLSGAYRHVVVADACNLPYADQNFATIVSNCVIEYIQDLEQAVWEISRVLALGGKFYLTMPTQKFNDWFYLSLVLCKLGLHGLAERQINRYNAHQFHHHIYSVQTWASKLEQAGLKMENHRFYAGRLFSFVFSALDNLHHMFGRLISPKTGSSETRTAEAAGFLSANALGKCIAEFWWYLLKHFYCRERSAASEGAAVLIQARKMVV